VRDKVDGGREGIQEMGRKEKKKSLEEVI